MSALTHTPTDSKSVAAFRRWLTAAGAKVLPTKGTYEVIRFRGEAGISIIYRSQKGRATFSGEAARAWAKFAAGEAHQFEHSEDLPPVEHQVSKRAGRAVRKLPANAGLTIADVMATARVTTAAAHRFLAAEAAAGRMALTLGGPGQAARWFPTLKAAE